MPAASAVVAALDGGKVEREREGELLLPPLTSDDGHERERPTMDRRGSSTSSLGTVRGTRSRSNRERERDVPSSGGREETYSGSEGVLEGGRGREISRSRSRSKSRDRRRSPVRRTPPSPQALSPDDDYEEEPEELQQPAALAPSLLPSSSKARPSHLPDLSLPASLSTSQTSDWESATDSPKPQKSKKLIAKELFESSLVRTNSTVGPVAGGISGLGRVMSTGAREEAKLHDEEEEAEEGEKNAFGLDLGRSATLPVRRAGGAKFQMMEDNEEEDAAGSFVPELAPSMLDASNRSAKEPLQPTQVSTPPRAPPVHHTLPPSPAKGRSGAPAGRQQSFASPNRPVPPTLPSSQPKPPVSPSIPHPPSVVQQGKARKNSNASLMSVRTSMSARSTNSLSFGGLMGPPTAGRRGVRPGVARLEKVEGVGGFSSPVSPDETESPGRVETAYRRSESVTSLRSLLEASTESKRNVLARHSPTSSTPSPSSSSSSSALASLARLGTGGPSSTPGLARSALGSGRRTTSGYLATLREYAAGAISGVASSNPVPPPLKPSPLSPNYLRARNPGSSSSINQYFNAYDADTQSRPGSAGHSELGGRRSKPIVSKFVESVGGGFVASPVAPNAALPSHVPHTLPLSNLNPTTRGRHNSSTLPPMSTGAMSRTQQKALLARDRPTSPSSTSSLANLPGLNLNMHDHSRSSSVDHPPSSSSMESGERTAGMHKWALGLVREAERIEVQFRNVEKWRDVLGEVLSRVDWKSKDGRGRVQDGSRGGVGRSGSKASLLRGTM